MDLKDLEKEKDITERLRESALVYGPGYLQIEAADEIERLRLGWNACMIGYEANQKEVERLRMLVTVIAGHAAQGWGENDETMKKTMEWANERVSAARGQTSPQHPSKT